MLFLALSLFALPAFAHMQMQYPPPFRSEYNPYTTDIDYDMTSPLDANGDNYPCKGYQSLLNTPQGQTVATWTAGESHNFTVVGSATHGGGSCQASLSYDGGNTFTVIHSWVGACPLQPNWNFTLPNDTPAGDALFAWSWFNKIGNREMYMNCAHINIQAASSSKRSAAHSRRAPTDPFSSRPAIFVANVNNGCSDIEGKDLLFPHPGPDLDTASTNTAPPVGSCQ